MDTVVTGKVTLNGSPVGAGAVLFYNDSGLIGQGMVLPDGTYKARALPSGPAKAIYSARFMDASELDEDRGPKGKSAPPPPVPGRKSDHDGPSRFPGKAGSPSPGGPKDSPKDRTKLEAAQKKYNKLETTPFSVTLVRDETVSLDVNMTVP